MYGRRGEIRPDWAGKEATSRGKSQWSETLRRKADRAVVVVRLDMA